MADKTDGPYQVVALADLPEALTRGWGCTWKRDYMAALVRMENGVAVEVIGVDGGEPEDQTLWRDWDWVAPAMNEQAARIAALEAELAEHRADAGEVEKALGWVNGLIAGASCAFCAPTVTDDRRLTMEAHIVECQAHPASAMVRELRQAHATIARLEHEQRRDVMTSTIADLRADVVEQAAHIVILQGERSGLRAELAEVRPERDKFQSALLAVTAVEGSDLPVRIARDIARTALGPGIYPTAQRLKED